MTGRKIRSFLSVDLPKEMIEALVGLQVLLPVGRKVARDNLHLTLAFLGDQSEPVLQELHSELEALSTGPLSIRLNGVGCFGGDKPRLVFADVEPSEPLLQLQSDVTRAARRVGIVLRHERFHPHITLTRIGGALGPTELGQLHRFLEAEIGFHLPQMRCSSFSLCESTLGPSGARYDALAQYPLI